MLQCAVFSGVLKTAFPKSLVYCLCFIFILLLSTSHFILEEAQLFETVYFSSKVSEGFPHKTEAKYRPIPSELTLVRRATSLGGKSQTNRFLVCFLNYLLAFRDCQYYQKHNYCFLYGEEGQDLQNLTCQRNNVLSLGDKVLWLFIVFISVVSYYRILTGECGGAQYQPIDKIEHGVNFHGLQYFGKITGSSNRNSCLPQTPM